MRKRYHIEEIGLVLLYLGLGVASGLLWNRIVTNELQYALRLQQLGVPLKLDAFLNNWHHKMLAGAAAAPNQYRILTPWLVERLFPGLDVTGTIADSYLYANAYTVLRALFTGATLICFDRYLRTWFSRGTATAGTLCLAAAIPFCYYAVIQESDALNLLVIVLAFLLLVKKRDLWLVPLVLVGTLNRETALLIPAVYLLARWGEEPAKKVLPFAALLAACWAAVFVGLHVGYGPRPGYTPLIQWPGNVASGMPTLFAILVFGVLWVLPWLAPKDAPPMLRRALWLVPPFVLLHYIVAVVQEVRLFLPLAPILIPLSWWVLFPERQKPPLAPSKARPRR